MPYSKPSPNTDFSGAFADFLLGNLILLSSQEAVLVPEGNLNHISLGLENT